MHTVLPALAGGDLLKGFAAGSSSGTNGGSSSGSSALHDPLSCSNEELAVSGSAWG
jgi:hypothetical protein